MKTSNIISENFIPGGDVIIDGGLQPKLCILHLFNYIIKIGQIPDYWGKNIIVPIHKVSKKLQKSPDNYRPIAVLPC